MRRFKIPKEKFYSINKLNIKESDIVELYKELQSGPKISKILGIGCGTIYDVLEKHNIQRVKAGNINRKSKLNHLSFDKMDSEEKCYWAGFILADGCVYTSDKYRNSLTIGLSVKDIGHIIKFRDFIGTDNKIYEKETVGYSTGKVLCSISISSPKILSDLKEIGIEDKKTFNSNIGISLVKESLHRHFWRGVVDGDGFISISKFKNREQFSIGLVGNLDTISKFKEFIDGKIKTKAKIRKHCSIFQIAFRSKVGIEVAKLLYENCNVFLDRKYYKFIDYVSIERNRY